VGAAFVAARSALATSARFKAQRFLVAAMILAKPSLLIRRFAFGASAGTGASDSPRIFAHRFHSHPAPSTRNRHEDLRLLSNKSGLLFRCEHQVPVALVL
jgi:hypothetical protein